MALKTAVSYADGNLEAARIILANRHKYIAGSLMIQWAERVLAAEEERKAAAEKERWKKPKPEPDPEAPLFDGPEAA